MKILGSTIKMESTVSYAREKGGSNFASFLSASYQSHLAKNSNQGREIVADKENTKKIPFAIRTIKISRPDEIETSDKITVISRDNNKLENRKMLMLQKLIEALTGKKVKFVSLKDSQQSDLTDDFSLPIRNNIYRLNLTNLNSNSSNTVNRDISNDVEFKSNGTVTTADGKKIDFSINLNLDKETELKTDVKNDTGRTMTDPLVINFDAVTATLTDTKFSFDLDNDGNNERISFVSKGSGLLPIDLNNDGKINNGLELFGTKTGDGFMELSLKDSDENSWIDENDPIFEKLKIWTKDQDGKDNLQSLESLGIGAIYLNSADTSIKMTDSSGIVQGELTKTGVFLKENGTAGLIQNVQFVV